ncbi:hypothetical protein PCANC_15531 [Puccinia coronata f. sp. avenae]|uniref:ER membrane protein SH3 n=1 Tax=Puccinia coronata f. sp. avenae TaxID=200324 RepID=A0A2N5SIP8_9BASI|nr:hypothetical protein PCANC_15531 [Puccinia coronata f. sp. avenae]
MSTSAAPADPPTTTSKKSHPSPRPEGLPTLTVFDGVANALLLSSIGVLLGILFVVFTTDYALLYTNAPTTADAYLVAEQAYLKLWTTPLAVKAIFHLLLLLPILTLSIKLSRYTEAAIYFDGVSLGLILLVLGLYTGSTIPNLRKLAFTPSTQELVQLVKNSPHLIIPDHFAPISPASIIQRLIVFLSHPARILLKPQKALEQEQEFAKSMELNPIDTTSRHELLSVTAAGHSIAIFLLVGIILLQIGKVYAEIEDARLKAQFESQHVPKEKKDQ